MRSGCAPPSTDIGRPDARESTDRLDFPTPAYADRRITRRQPVNAVAQRWRNRPRVVYSNRPTERKPGGRDLDNTIAIPTHGAVGDETEPPRARVRCRVAAAAACWPACRTWPAHEGLSIADQLPGQPDRGGLMQSRSQGAQLTPAGAKPGAPDDGQGANSDGSSTPDRQDERRCGAGACCGPNSPAAVVLCGHQASHAPGCAQTGRGWPSSSSSASGGRPRVPAAPTRENEAGCTNGGDLPG